MNQVTQNLENRFIEGKHFPLTLFQKALPQLKSFNALPMRSIFASLKCQTPLEYGGG